VYDAAPPQPLQAPKKKMPTWAIVLIVIGSLIVIGPLCLGVFGAVSVPVFMNASGNAQERSCFANQRTIAGAAQVYLAENEDATLPSDWDSLMSVLVPSILKAEPTCPSGGSYSITSSGGSLRVECSTHGSVEDESSAP